ncbi:DUF817 domain-containing protein [Kitasatospora sp. NPDC058406]|uniref:DUF817 domain-containing protein n=1 Tax=Kitasatospora sp. NPDC058406 TaxID=3346483 RepID=UPI0036634519
MHVTTPASYLAQLCRELTDFAWRQTRACSYAIALLAGVAASTALPSLPLARYDILVVYGILLTLTFWRCGWETGRDVAVIAVCHVIGLVFELVKVHLGSWSYPEPAVLKIGGVPLYGGFLYSAVASYVCRAWHLFDLRLTRYRRWPTAVVAALIYVNFFTHHWLPDARWPLAAMLLAVTAGTTVSYRVRGDRRRMPLALSFLLIGFFLWLAENLATYSGAWRYPHQLQGWEPVAPAKIGAWTLLISVTFVLATIGRLRPPKSPRSP